MLDVLPVRSLPAEPGFLADGGHDEAEQGADFLEPLARIVNRFTGAVQAVSEQGGGAADLLAENPPHAVGKLFADFQFAVHRASPAMADVGPKWPGFQPGNCFARRTREFPARTVGPAVAKRRWIMAVRGRQLRRQSHIFAVKLAAERGRTFF
jgi:hypothetical protein